MTQNKHPAKYETLEDIIKYLWSLYPGESGGGWRVVANLISADDFKISFGMVHRIAVKRIAPKDPRIRRFFNLPPFAEYPVCVYCGEVHTLKSCPEMRKATARKRQRIEIDSNLTPDQLEYLHRLTVAERTKILLDSRKDQENE